MVTRPPESRMLSSHKTLSDQLTKFLMSVNVRKIRTKEPAAWVGDRFPVSAGQAQRAFGLSLVPRPLEDRGRCHVTE